MPAAATCVCLLLSLLACAAVASGKKPPWANGQGSPHGHASSDAATTAAPQADATASTKHEARAVATASPSRARKEAKQGKGKDGSGQGSGSSTSTPPPSTPVTTTPPASATQPVTTAGVNSASRGGHRRAATRTSRGPAGSTRAAGGAAATGHLTASGRANPATARSAGARRSASKPRPGDARAKAVPTSQSSVVRTFEKVVNVVPTALKAIIAVLAFLTLVAAIAWFFVARSARYLKRQRGALLREIGVLQAALLPEVPAEIGGLRPSVAYRPADGPAAGGDFYDAFPLEGGRAGILIGDVSGHGRDALMRTSLMRHTLRAYLDAGLEPRTALQVGGRVLERGLEELATVILATYDPSRNVLRYAGAGHPPPVFLGAPDHPPVTQGSSPPIGAGVPTGLRQTTITMPPGSAICLFTDGLIEARRDGTMIGRLGLASIISELGPDTTAEQLLDRVAAEVDEVSDDMAACLFTVEGDAEVASFRHEELEVRREDLADGVVERFLDACGVADHEAIAAATRDTVEVFGGAIVGVSIGTGAPAAEVHPANVESLASADARRSAA